MLRKALAEAVLQANITRWHPISNSLLTDCRVKMCIRDSIQRLDVRTLAEYSEGHITKTININVMDDSFASMADSLCKKTNRWLYIVAVENEARRLRQF